LNKLIGCIDHVGFQTGLATRRFDSSGVPLASYLRSTAEEHANPSEAVDPQGVRVVRDMDV